MTAQITMKTHAENYLIERRRLGFGLRTPGYSVISFAHYIDGLNSQEPLTVEMMADWARQDQGNSGKPSTWARRLKNLRSFCRYLQQFEPRTEVPDDSIFGRIGQRLAPHIYSEQEIIDLLAAARNLGSFIPGLRGATYETLFGLIASTGLRVSEALHLLDTDVDLKWGMLTIRQTKFAKSRQVPMHPSTVDVLQQYRSQRNLHIEVSDETPFFVGTRGRHLGHALDSRQVHRVFIGLRDQLGWINRGAHNGPRIHDLRHTFIVRRVLLWQAQGLDVDQKMLALSTYVGHAMVTNTYWYLTGIPQLMAVAAEKFESFTQIPEVSHD
ncbi:tyrosine-type recombinase/integrase [Methylobacter svalbardensis]|uniref:tyrosine-type recombinase/integrase n=1 Tax=Methylobacter svalbardensis TaxID=3080016 RepID=UPI0030EB34C9